MTLHGPAGRVAAGFLAAVLALGLTSCGSSGGSSSGSTNKTPTGSESGNKAACGAVKKAADELTTQVRAWRAGIASRNEVLSAARKLGSAVSDQAAAAAGQTSKDLDRLGSAITNLVTTATSPGATKHEISNAEAKVMHAADAFGTTCKK
jgi:hypothetical protein